MTNSISGYVPALLQRLGQAVKESPRLTLLVKISALFAVATLGMLLVRYSNGSTKPASPPFNPSKSNDTPKSTTLPGQVANIAQSQLPPKMSNGKSSTIPPQTESLSEPTEGTPQLDIVKNTDPESSIDKFDYIFSVKVDGNTVCSAKLELTADVFAAGDENSPVAGYILRSFSIDPEYAKKDPYLGGLFVEAVFKWACKNDTSILLEDTRLMTMSGLRTFYDNQSYYLEKFGVTAYLHPSHLIVVGKKTDETQQIKYSKLSHYQFVRFALSVYRMADIAQYLKAYPEDIIYFSQSIDGENDATLLMDVWLNDMNTMKNSLPSAFSSQEPFEEIYARLQDHLTQLGVQIL